MTNNECLKESSLLELLDDDHASPDLRRHLDGCDNCKHDLDRLKDELHGIAELFDAETRNSLANVKAMPVNRPQLHGSLETDVTFETETSNKLQKLIGKYPVIRLLGSGGQGRIYLVRHPKLGIELVAKVYRTERVNSDKNARMLKQEGETLADLRNAPDIATIFDLDADQNGMYLIMEYVRGKTLRQLIPELRHDEKRALKLMISICRAIDYAHSKGVIHGDLKPDNILVDEMDQVKIIDFGLARIRDAWRDGTDVNWAGGTLVYMPPEQARKEELALTPAADVFSLGAILQEILTGERPYEGDSVATIEKNARNERVIVSEGLRNRSYKIQRAVERSLAADPRVRHQNGGELAFELESIADSSSRFFGVGLIFGVAAIVAVLFMYFQNTRPKNYSAPIGILGKPNIVEAGQFQESLPFISGELVHITTKVPAGLHWALVWIDSERQVEVFTESSKRLPLMTIDAGPSSQRLLWPSNGQNPDDISIVGTPGNEGAVVVGSKMEFTETRIEQLRVLVESTVADENWVPIPDNAVVRLSSDDVVPAYSSGANRSLGESRKSALANFRLAVNRIRNALASEYEFLAGEFFLKPNHRIA